MSKRVHNKRPFFRFIKSIIRLFKRKPKFVNLAGELEEGSIYLSNHSAAAGPLIYELYFPLNFRYWGTYEMCGTIKQRWTYLATIYFPNKKHFSKPMSKILATLVCPFMHMFYKGMQVIPTYPDGRLVQTFRTSHNELEKGINLIIFPENSSDGYHNVLKEYFAGFYVFAKRYYNNTGKNVKIYNMYYSKKHNTIVIDKPVTIEQLMSSGLTSSEIANKFKDRINQLADEYIYKKSDAVNCGELTHQQTK